MFLRDPGVPKVTLEVQPLFDAARRYWQARADAAPRCLPEAARFRPEEMAPWMPHAMLVDIDRVAVDVRVRLVGTRLVAFYGQEFTGMTLGALPFALDQDNDATRRSWCLAAARPVAAQGWAEHAFALDRTVVLDRLLLPYAGRIPGTRMLMVLQIPRLSAIDDWRVAARRAGECGIERRAQARQAIGSNF